MRQHGEARVVHGTRQLWVAPLGRLRGLRGAAVAMVPFLAVLAMWQAIASLGWVNSLILPSPVAIAARLVELAGPAEQWRLGQQVGVSLMRVAIGSALGAAAGLMIGIILGVSQRARSVSWWLVVLLMSIPALAWVPILLLSLGRGDGTAITVVAIGVMFPVLVNTTAGIRAIPREYMWVMRSLGGGKKDLMWRVLVPGSFPFIATGFRIGLAQGWRTLVAAEMLATTSGIGFSIFAARQSMSSAEMYIGILALAVMGLLTEYLVLQGLERRFAGQAA